MMGLLNIGSLVLGLIAWLLPIVNLMRYKNHDHRNWAILSIMSISACGHGGCRGVRLNSSSHRYHLIERNDVDCLS